MIEKDLRGESREGGGKVTGVLGGDKWMRVREGEIDRNGLQAV